jgi:LPXTG-site transpeptidase (sortase) family protein
MPKRLLLPGAKSGVLLGNPAPLPSIWGRRLALLLGVVAILVGGADAFSRVAERVFDNDAVFIAFAPAATLFTTETVQTFVPTRLTIPALGVNAAVEQVGKTEADKMATPNALVNVGWYKLGSKPGEDGNAVFAGHVNSRAGLPGVFKNLSKIKKGDTVTVTGGDGASLTYEVESITTYTEGNAPLEQIFTTTGPSNLVLITCEGDWDEATATFDKRLIVVARLLTP